MGYVILKGEDKKDAKPASEITTRNSNNPKLIIGGKGRSEEEEKEIEKLRKVDEAKWEKTRLEILAKKNNIKANSNEGNISENIATKIALAENVEQENSMLKNKLSTAEDEKKIALAEKEAEIEKLKIENEELAKNSANGSSESKPIRVKGK